MAIRNWTLPAEIDIVEPPSPKTGLVLGLGVEHPGTVTPRISPLGFKLMLDVPGCERRIYKSVVIAPVSGPGSLNKFELQRRAKEIIAEAGANDAVTLREFEKATLSTTLQQQAATWIEVVHKRKRKPKRHTAVNPKTETLGNVTTCIEWGGPSAEMEMEDPRV